MADRAGESSFLKNLAPMADAEKGNPAPASSAGEKPEAIKADRPIASLFRMTDTGNGKLFVNQHYQNVRYMHGKKQWYVWNGKLWKPDTDKEVHRLTETVADEWRKLVPTPRGDKEMARILRWVGTRSPCLESGPCWNRVPYSGKSSSSGAS